MGQAYDLLDDDTKEQIDGRVATHAYASAFGRSQPPEVQERMRALPAKRFMERVTVAGDKPF